MPEGMQDHAERRVEPGLAARDELDHAFDHLLGRFKVGNHSVFEGTDGLDVLVRFSVHLLSQAADGHHVARHAVFGHDGRFIHHHFVLVVDDGVCRAQIHGNFLREKVEQSHDLKVEGASRQAAAIPANLANG